MIPDNEVRLSHMAPGGGCAAKIGPGTLQGILEQLPRFSDENLLVGIETSDDGAVYRISPELALIQTLDFFPPMVDDPFLFGQIAAANALSDIYAMGGVPKVALNIVAWPNCVNPAILGKILAGGAEKVKEAGAVLAGGHSIQDDVPKYGLSVTGFVHPDQMYTNCGGEAGGSAPPHQAPGNRPGKHGGEGGDGLPGGGAGGFGGDDSPEPAGGGTSAGV